MFHKDDFTEVALNFSEIEPKGIFDHMNWEIIPGPSPSEQLALMVSLHENAHKTLNITSVYGGLLSISAQVLKLNRGKRDAAKDLLIKLKENCEFAHEVFATWWSMNPLKTDASDETVEKLLEDNREYLRYYRTANNLVINIPSLTLKTLSVLAVIRTCFQSRELAELAVNNLFSIPLDAINPLCFPNNRLAFLIQNLDENKLLDWIREFMDLRKQTPVFDYLARQLEGYHESDMDKALSDWTNFDSHILEFLEHKIIERFEQIGSYSISGDLHLNYYKLILAKSEQIVSGLKDEHLVFLEKPEYEKSVLVQFESEIIRFKANRPACLIIFPENVEDNLIAEFRKTLIPEYPYIIVGTRLNVILAEQYNFIREPDKEWIEEGVKLITFFRFQLYNQEGEETMILIPVFSREQANKFQESLQKDINVFGCMSLSALGSDAGEEEWSDDLYAYYLFDCKWYCHLNDISLLYCLEKYLLNLQPVTYHRFEVEASGNKFIVLMFSYDVCGFQRKMLIPCSAAYAALTEQYIQRYFKDYQSDETLADQQILVEMIASWIIEHEYSFSFRNGGLEDFY